MGVSFGLLLFLGVISVGSAFAADAKSGDPIPAGDVRGKDIYYSVVFYYAPDPKTNTLEAAKAITQSFLPGVPLTADTTNELKPPFVGFEEEAAPLVQYPVPETSYFKYAGRGLTAGDIAAMQKTSRATRLVLVAPKEDAWTSGRKFTKLVWEYAQTTHAFIWDSATRECFSREAWQTERLASWAPGEIPDLRKQITIHLYRADDDKPYLRAITLGMEKFALPDVVVERLIGSDNRAGGNLINIVCQTLAEDPVVTNGANQVFSLGALRSEKLKAQYDDTTLEGAEKSAPLELLRGTAQEGDPDNALIEISFRLGVGKTEDERRESVLSKFWGSSDSIIGVKHTDEILEASSRAKKRLPTIRGLFDKGLAPGERLLVKGPFARDDGGDEWMWVEVTKWPSGKTLEGILQNDPFYIRKLKAGAKVEVRVQDIFDYIFYRADGTSEGNETGRLIEKQAGPKITK